RPNLLRVLKNYLEAHKLKADWRAILSAPSEYLVNSLSVVCPYGAEEKQALLEAKDLKTRAEVLMALAEMELASSESGSGGAVN
ncbi:MAG TPA: peptidase S16, partial [Hyphomicrobiaceae bacterium]|nr:peptidase S16 [Hyphomicrobiaceae bacterium]